MEPLTPDTAAQFGLRRGSEGVVITGVEPNGPAAEAGIRKDDVILEVNRKPVKSAAELREALQASGTRPALLLVYRDGRSLFIAVQTR